MAKVVSFKDDLDGSDGAETRRFSVGGRTYEIDLVDENEAKLVKAVQRFINKAKDLTPAPRNPAHDPYDGVDQGIVRSWAQAEGLEVNDKGKIPLDLVYAWKRAQAAKAAEADDNGGDAEDESAGVTEPGGEPGQQELAS